MRPRNLITSSAAEGQRAAEVPVLVRDGDDSLELAVAERCTVVHGLGDTQFAVPERSEAKRVSALPVLPVASAQGRSCASIARSEKSPSDEERNVVTAPESS